MDDAIATGLKRTAEMCAVFMIGNGTVGFLQPKRHVELWTSDRPWIDRFARADRERSPASRRLHATAQIGAGLLLASLLQPTARQRAANGRA